MRPYLAQIRSNLRLMGRDRSVLFFNYFFPLLFFVVFATSFGGAKNPSAMGQVVNMVLVLGVLGSGFFGAGMRAVQDRETNILRRFKVAPVGPAPIIVASMVSGLVSFLPSVLFVVLLAHFWMHMPLPARPVDFLVFISLGSLAFRAMGMIVASVVNSAQESQIITQMIYLPMLFLSGATFPLQFFPRWLQTLSQFVPATYLFAGMQSIFIAHGTLASNWLPIVSLIITLAVALFIGIKLFRWEKEEKIPGRAKLWIAAVMLPFFLMGAYQSRSHQNLTQDKILARNLRRSESRVFQNARIFAGDGTVVQDGAVLIQNGRIAKVFNAPVPDAKAWNAEVVDASGQTLLPGLIDVHVHLSAPGGVYENPSDYANAEAPKRELAAYAYSGVSAVRSVGDPLNPSLQLRETVGSGDYLGAGVHVCGPLFTAEGGRGTEYGKLLPARVRQMMDSQTVRTPHSAAEAAQQVLELKQKGVECIAAVLDSGSGGTLFPRMDSRIFRAIASAAKENGLPVVTETGDARDVHDAIEAGAGTIEHGSTRDLIPDEDFRSMAQKGIAYDPALSEVEALGDVERHNLTLLDRSLVQQAAPKLLLDATRRALSGSKASDVASGGDTNHGLEIAEQNLVHAWKAGVRLITGSDAGSLLVIHGPTVQHEIELWVKAGIPAAAALKAATGDAAGALGLAATTGFVRPGFEASIFVVEGNPLQDVSSLERITYLLVKGEHVDRAGLFNQDQGK